MAGGSLSAALDLTPAHSLDLSPPCKQYHSSISDSSSGDESGGDLESGPEELSSEGAFYPSEESLGTFIVKKTPAGEVTTDNIMTKL